MRIAILTTDSREHYKEYTNPVPYFGTAPEALLQGFAQLPDVEVHVLSCIRAPMKSPEKIAPNIFYHSLVVPRLGWMTTLYQGTTRAVRKKLGEIQPDIVHGQGTERDCAVSTVLSGFPNVLTIHGNMRVIAQVNHARPFSFYWLAGRLERFALPRTDGIVCITRYTQAAVSDLARRTWIVPNGVDASFFDVDAQPPADRPPRILCVGYINVRKNQNAFIRALDPLAKQRKLEVLFFGSGEPNSSYEHEFHALVKERPWCHYGGLANREKLKETLKGTAVLALPSLEDNCPMVVLEAMAAGVPVVAAKVGGVPELVESGKTGYFCDPLDAASMRGAIEHALDHRDEAAVIVNRAREQARERYHPASIARRHVEIYREVLKEVGR